MISFITNLPYVLLHIVRQKALKYYLKLNKNEIVTNNKHNPDSILIINICLAVFVVKLESGFYIIDCNDNKIRVIENELINQLNMIMIC